MENSNASAKKRRKSNRGKIVEAAVTCFVEEGIHQTSIRDIAERAGVSQGNMYNHFASKEALIAEIARLDGDDVVQVIAAGDGLQPISAIRAICASYLSQAMRQWQVVLELEITVLALRSPEVAQAFSGSQTQLHAALVTLIETGQSAGDIPPGLAPEIANMILDLLSAHAQRLGLQDRQPNTDERAILARSLSGILGTQIID